MDEIALAVVLSCALACASADSNVASRQTPREPEAIPQTITAAPTTIRVELDDVTRQALERQLAARSLAVARMIIRDLHPQAAQALKGVRIFIEKPDANASTPAADPHYADSFALGLGPSESVLLNIAPTLVRLWDSRDLTGAKLDERKALRITFVPEPWDYTPRLPPDFALTVQHVAVEVPRQP
jgi:hypothetical protein